MSKQKKQGGGRNVVYRVMALVMAGLMLLGTLAGVIVYFVH